MDSGHCFNFSLMDFFAYQEQREMREESGAVPKARRDDTGAVPVRRDDEFEPAASAARTHNEATAEAGFMASVVRTRAEA